MPLGCDAGCRVDRLVGFAVAIATGEGVSPAAGALVTCSTTGEDEGSVVGAGTVGTAVGVAVGKGTGEREGPAVGAVVTSTVSVPSLHDGVSPTHTVYVHWSVPV